MSEGRGSDVAKSREGGSPAPGEGGSPVPAGRDDGADWREGATALRWTGVVALIVGTLAVLFPLAASVGVGLFTGAMLAALGVAELVRAVRTRRSPSRWWTAAFGVVALAAGALMLLFPAVGVITLSAWLIAYFVVGGGFRVATALQHRGERGWLWMLGSGALSVLLGIALWLALPGAAYWTLGLVFGIDAILLGGAMLMMADTGRRPPA